MQHTLQAHLSSECCIPGVQGPPVATSLARADTEACLDSALNVVCEKTTLHVLL